MFDRLAHVLGLDDFDKRHKVAFVLLIVAMLAVVVLWGLQLRKNIISPLYPSADETSTQTLNQPTQSNEESQLRAKDTDTDALSDWDELNLYKTSPYLADSDSDGFTDKEEIDSGNDPNCPEGQSCSATSGSTTIESNEFSNPALNDLLNRPTSGGTATTELSAEEKAALQETFGANTDVAQLRQMLLAAGMDQELLDNLSDEEILTTFEQLVQ